MTHVFPNELAPCGLIRSKDPTKPWGGTMSIFMPLLIPIETESQTGQGSISSSYRCGGDASRHWRKWEMEPELQLRSSRFIV